MPSSNAIDQALTRQHPEAFGRYHLLGRIATGGMAEVYIARCGELLGMQTLIAVKRILPVHAADEQFIQMFQREASIALRLQHRSIARVFEVGKVTEDWFLSMELVQGENLARVTDALTARRLHWDPNLIAFIGSEIALALHYAHTLSDARGRPLRIVHRDVSPENIMLGYDGSVKIIDFGIALCESYASLTTQGAVRGKVQYVSPEQALTHKLDGRSDVFSLGAVLYECLAGSQPFERTSPMDTLDAVVNQTIPPIPYVSEKLNSAIIKALEKDPENRYPNAEQFSQALLAAIDVNTTGSGKVAQLVSSLFPRRLARWREIQEIAGQGYGFKEPHLHDWATLTPPVEPIDNQQTAKAEKYYVISDDETEPIATGIQPATTKRHRRVLLTAGVAAGAALLTVPVVNWFHARKDKASARPATPAPPAAGTETRPRIEPLPSMPSEPDGQRSDNQDSVPLPPPPAPKDVAQTTTVSRQVSRGAGKPAGRPPSRKKRMAQIRAAHKRRRARKRSAR